MAPRHRARPALGVRHRAGLVDRRLRAVPRDSRPRGRAAVDRVARAAAAPAPARAGPGARELAATCSSTSTCSGSPTRSGGGARRRAPRRRAVRRPAVHGGRRQRRRVGRQHIQARRLGGRAARCVQRHRTGLGHAGLPLGRRGGRRFPLAARARPAQRAICSTATASITWSASTERTGGRATAASRSSRPPTRMRRLALGERVLTFFASRAPRSSPRIWARCPISCGRRSARLGVPGFRVFRWERALARGRPAVSRSARVSAACRSRRRARTTPSRSSCGGTGRPSEERALVSELPTVAALAGGADWRRRLTIPPSASAARSAVRVGIGSAADADSGCVRLARSR